MRAHVPVWLFKVLFVLGLFVVQRLARRRAGRDPFRTEARDADAGKADPALTSGKPLTPK
jgi:hypothetical protein